MRSSPTMLLLVLSACFPKMEGVDQVPDHNVQSTMQKDAHWNYAKNSVVDKLAPEMLALAPGCGVGVMVDGEIDYLHGYGWAREELSSGDNRVYVELGKDGLGNIDAGNSKADGEWHVGTVGAIGSVSKVFTSLAAVKLSRTGGTGWDLDMTVDDELTSTGDLGDLVLRDLLDHTAGAGGAGGGFSPDFGGSTLDYLYPAFMKHPAAYPRFAYKEYEATTPADGGEYYSNTGYGVVGAMIDQYASDHGGAHDGYEKWVWRHVGQPYPSLLHADNMRSMVLAHSWRKDDIPEYAYGYARTSAAAGEAPAEWESSQEWTMIASWSACEEADGTSESTIDECEAIWEGWEGPAGGWAMSVGDLTRLTIALDQNVVVSRPTLKVMGAPSSKPFGGDADYGLGLKIQQDGVAKPVRWGHEGRVAGHTAAMYYWPSHSVEGLVPGQEMTHHASFGVAMICNGYVGPTKFSGWANRLRDTYQKNGSLNIGYVPGMDSLPVPASDPVPEANLVGKVYAFDVSMAHATSPDHLALDLMSDGNTPLLEFTSKSGLMSARLGAGSVRSGVASQDSKVSVLSFGTPNYRSNPVVAMSSTGTLTLPTAYSDVTLQSPSVEATVTSGGDHLIGLELSGRLDLRDLASLGDRADRLAACAEFGPRGVCVPCVDGKNECLDVTISDITANAVTGSLK